MEKNVLLIPVCILSLALLMSETAHCQGFLKKLKQKVENVVVGTDESEDNTDRDSEEGEPENATPTPTDRIPKLRVAASSWDEMIQPSKATTAKALLNELPALPTIAALATPTEEARTNYYRKIVAADMRVEELDQQNTCSDEEMLAARDKLCQELAGVMGLTVDEMKPWKIPTCPKRKSNGSWRKQRSP